MISLSLQPSPASETSAFNKISAFVSRLAGIFPLVLSASSRSRSSALSRTTYLFTATSRAAILASVPKGAEGSESIKGWELVDAADYAVSAFQDNMVMAAFRLIGAPGAPPNGNYNNQVPLGGAASDVGPVAIAFRKPAPVGS